VHLQKDGSYYVGAAPMVGRIGGGTLSGLADLVERTGALGVRLTAHQKLVALGVPADQVDAFVAGLEPLGLTAQPSPFRRSTIACTGLEFCKLAIVDTKDTATEVITELETRLADLTWLADQPIGLNVNGCPNSCARIQTADIGLKGQIITVDGEQVPGFQVHLGGGLAGTGQDAGGLGRTVRGLKVPASEVADYVERVVRRYGDERQDGETFARWAHRADEEALQ
jgi:sulfite reductase (ferredoxin)